MFASLCNSLEVCFWEKEFDGETLRGWRVANPGRCKNFMRSPTGVCGKPCFIHLLVWFFMQDFIGADILSGSLFTLGVLPILRYLWSRTRLLFRPDRDIWTLPFQNHARFLTKLPPLLEYTFSTALFQFKPNSNSFENWTLKSHVVWSTQVTIITLLQTVRELVIKIHFLTFFEH